MRLPAWFTPRWRVARARPAPGAIFLYHRVAQLARDPWEISVTPEQFDEQLQVLRRHGTCVPIRDFVTAVATADTPVFSITFDDGYADNLTVAQPILEKHGVPATFFVVSETIGSGEEFWWDALERVFLSPGELPRGLRLTIAGREHAWDLGDAACYSTADAHRDRTWRAEQDEPPTRRHIVFLEVWRALFELQANEREEALQRVLQWAQVDARARLSHTILSRDQLFALSRSGDCEIGAHTRTHAALPAVPLREQIAEIGGSKADLERLIGRPVGSFSYPYGRLSDATRQAVAQAGFHAACASGRRAVSHGADPFTLPRIPVWNWTGDRFENVVMHFLNSSPRV